MMPTVSSEISNTLNTALESLDEPFRTVLKLKYGLAGTPRLNRKEIAGRIQHSPRKIDILEKKGVRNLRKPAIARPLMRVLEDVDEFIWNTVSEKISEAGSVFFKGESYEPALDKLPGELQLIMKCVYDHLVNWISENAEETEIAWFRSASDPKIVLEKLGDFLLLIKNFGCPVPQDMIMQKLEIDQALMDLLIALHPSKLEKFIDYIYESPISSIQLRAMRIHRLLRFGFPSKIASRNDIIDKFNMLYQDDQLIGRTLESVLNRHASLFQMETGGKETVSPSYISGDDNDAGDDAYIERPWEKMSAIHLFSEIMEEKQIDRRSRIFKNFVERSKGRYQASSLYNCLFETKNIVRAAPTVLAQKEDVEILDSFCGESDILLNPKDCKDYVVARYSGEPMNTYPLWTFAMEYRWCRWAQNEALWLFQSLLYISEPESWPAPDEEKRTWLEKKRMEGFYHFEVPIKLPIEKKPPMLQDVFMMALQAKSQGAVNWLRINDTLSQKRSFHAAAPILAVMILLDVVLPAESWQRLHKTGPGINAFIEHAETEIYKKGFVHWDDEAGLHFREQILSRNAHESLGWLRPVELEALRTFLKPGSIQKNIDELKTKKFEKPPSLEQLSKVKPHEQLSLF